MALRNYGYPKELLDVVYNGVNTSLFNSSIEEKNKIKSIFNANEIIVSYVGRKKEAKGYFVALKVFKELLNKYHEVTIFSVGPTPEDVKNDPHYKEMMELKSELLESSNFIDLPALEHEELRKIYAITDILLFPDFRDKAHKSSIKYF